MRKGAIIILFVVMAAMLIAQVDALAISFGYNRANADGYGPWSTRASTFTAQEQVAVDNEKATISPWGATAQETSVAVNKGVAAASARGQWSAHASSCSVGLAAAVEA